MPIWAARGIAARRSREDAMRAMHGIASSNDISFAHYIGILRVWQNLSSLMANFFYYSPLFRSKRMVFKRTAFHIFHIMH